MLIRFISTVLCTAGLVHGLNDASPFFLLSTETLRTRVTNLQIAAASTVQEAVLQSLDSCHNSLYIIVQQPGLNTADLRDGAAMPHIRRRIEGGAYKQFDQIPYVMGALNTREIASFVSRTCGIEHADLKDYLASSARSSSAVLTLRHPALCSDEAGRKEMLQQHDADLELQLSSLVANSTPHVLIYTSTPPVGEHADADRESLQSLGYEMDESPAAAVMHTDLKRDLGGVRARQSDDPQAGLPLFERYQFFTPAIFMGLAVMVLLLVILNVGISAIAGLEVSYMAFSKEMGPQAQQKGKQQ